MNEDKLNISKQILLSKNQPIDSKTQIDKIDNYLTIQYPYKGMIFYTIQEDKYYKVISTMDGYFFFGTEKVVTSPQGVENVDYTVIKDYFIDSYEELLLSKEDIAVILDKKVDVVDGKSLIADDLIEKVENLYENQEVIELINTVDTKLSSDITKKADKSHTHNIEDVIGLQDELDNKQPVGDYATNTELELGLSTKAEENHTHTVSDLTDKENLIGDNLYIDDNGKITLGCLKDNGSGFFISPDPSKYIGGYTNSLDNAGLLGIDFVKEKDIIHGFGDYIKVFNSFIKNEGEDPYTEMLIYRDEIDVFTQNVDNNQYGESYVFPEGIQFYQYGFGSDMDEHIFEIRNTSGIRVGSTLNSSLVSSAEVSLRIVDNISDKDSLNEINPVGIDLSNDEGIKIYSNKLSTSIVKTAESGDGLISQELFNETYGLNDDSPYGFNYLRTIRDFDTERTFKTEINNATGLKYTFREDSITDHGGDYIISRDVFSSKLYRNGGGYPIASLLNDTTQEMMLYYSPYTTDMYSGYSNSAYSIKLVSYYNSENYTSIYSDPGRISFINNGRGKLVISGNDFSIYDINHMTFQNGAIIGYASSDDGLFMTAPKVLNHEIWDNPEELPDNSLTPKSYVDTKVSSSPDNFSPIQTIWSGTQAEYDAIEFKDENTMYVISNL